MKQPVILLTSFSPFLGNQTNASQEVAKQIPDEVAGCHVEKRTLSVSWFDCVYELDQAMAETRPNMVLGTGMGYPRPPILIERLGVNLACGPSGDMQTDMREHPIFAHAPAAYFSTFPYDAMHRRLKEEGIPVRYSFSAGQNQCNCVLYASLHLAAVKYPGTTAGFIHIPVIGDGSENTMTLEQSTRAILCCLDESARILTRPVRTLDEYRESL